MLTRSSQFERALFFARRAVSAAILLAGGWLTVPAAAVPQAPPAPAGTVLEVTDDAGRTVKIPHPVRRIVSLAPSVTETIYALGVQDRLVGDTDFCDFPPDARTKPKVGGAINPNLEQVIALRPDLVVVTKQLNRRETVEAFDRMGVPTYATDPRSVEAMLASVEKLADALGVHDQGQALAAGMRGQLSELKRRLEGRTPRRVLFVVWYEPLISIGRDTFLADALRWAGAESVVDTAQDWPHVNIEEVVRWQPEFLVFASSHSEAIEKDIAALAKRAGWRNLEAVKNGRIAIISDAVNRPAPRLIEAIEQLARQLHPAAFAEQSQISNLEFEIRRAGASR
jgi:iron complex transport system substrate-binding protein